MSQLKLKTYL